MTDPAELLQCFGTAEVIQQSRQVVVGDMAYQLGQESVRQICWKGREVIRAITWPVRDSDWGTMRPTVIEEVFNQAETCSDYQLHFTVGDNALDCRVSIRGESSGEIQASIEMQANADFTTNRAGFTVLHPIAGVAGSDLQVSHGNGTVEDTQFPTLISPDQPVKDIVGLHHALYGIDIDIRFEGEIFEMEDQRNWSDASYKTYCVPLVHPFTYTIAQGETSRQTIKVRLSGGNPADGADTTGDPLKLVELDELAPQIGLAVDENWPVTSTTQELVSRCHVQFILARVNVKNESAALDSLARWSEALEQSLDLELLVPDTVSMSVLTRLADKLKESGVKPAHVVALPEAYLASYQPSGPWPQGLTPGDTLLAAKAAFPDAAIGTGMLTNFTEFNRCRPEPGQYDYVTHANTAIVHAADDQSVMETLEALPQIFSSTRSLCDAGGFRLGLVSIGARTNPYGSATVANTAQTRQALAQVDPRQRGLFAAAWAVGVLSATCERSIEAITLAAPAGPFGIVWQEQNYPQEGFDDDADAMLYPLFHIVRAAAGMSALPRIDVSPLPDSMVAYGVRAPAEYRLLLANTLPQARTVSLGRNWQLRTLDTHSHAEAVRDPDWLVNSTASYSDKLTLHPFASAYLTLSRQDI